MITNKLKTINKNEKSVSGQNKVRADIFFGSLAVWKDCGEAASPIFLSERRAEARRETNKNLRNSNWRGRRIPLFFSGSFAPSFAFLSYGWAKSLKMTKGVNEHFVIQSN